MQISMERNSAKKECRPRMNQALHSQDAGLQSLPARFVIAVVGGSLYHRRSVIKTRASSAASSTNTACWISVSAPSSICGRPSASLAIRAAPSICEVNNVSDERDFFLFLIKRYVRHKGKPTGTVLKEREARSVTQKIYDEYWAYHTARIENAFADIDSLLVNGRHAW